MNLEEEGGRRKRRTKDEGRRRKRRTKDEGRRRKEKILLLVFDFYLLFHYLFISFFLILLLLLFFIYKKYFFYFLFNKEIGRKVEQRKSRVHLPYNFFWRKKKRSTVFIRALPFFIFFLYFFNFLIIHI